MLRAGVDGAIDPILRNHFRDLLGGALMKVQTHIGVAAAELLDHFRKHVARLRVRGANGKAAPPLIAQLGSQVANGLSLLEDLQGPIDDLLARRSDAGEIAALARENLEAQFILKQLDLLAHPRLGGMQFLGSSRYVKSALGHGREVAQLVQLHEYPSPSDPSVMFGQPHYNRAACP